MFSFYYPIYLAQPLEDSTEHKLDTSTIYKHKQEQTSQVHVNTTVRNDRGIDNNNNIYQFKMNQYTFRGGGGVGWGVGGCGGGQLS